MTITAHAVQVLRGKAVMVSITVTWSYWLKMLKQSYLLSNTFSSDITVAIYVTANITIFLDQLWNFMGQDELRVGLV